MGTLGFDRHITPSDVSDFTLPKLNFHQFIDQSGQRQETFYISDDSQSLDSKGDFHSGCHHKQSFSGPLSPGQ